MRRKVIKTPAELPSSWMLLQCACSEEEALKTYHRRYKKEPTTMIILKQTTGTLIYLNYPVV